MKGKIRNYFLFDHSSLDPWERKISQRRCYNVQPEEVVMETLEKYSNGPLGSWKHDIYTLRTEITRSAAYPSRTYLDQKVCVLQFDGNYLIALCGMTGAAWSSYR